MASIAARMLLPVSLLLAGWVGQPQAADEASSPAWTIAEGPDDPSYAAVAPVAANVNVATVVLACEEAWGTRVLQLQLYLTDDGPLQPDAMQSLPCGAAPTHPDHGYAGVAQSPDRRREFQPDDGMIVGHCSS